MTTANTEGSRTADPLTAQATALAKRVEKTAGEAGRESLLEGLRAELARAPTAATTVVVCGETNRGKSALVNALLDRPGLLPVSAERSTGTHVAVRGSRPGEEEGAVAHRLNGETVPVPFDELEEWVTDDEPAEKEIGWIEIVLEHPLLASGVTLVDSPGVGGLGRAHGRIALSALGGAEAGLLVVDGGAPISAPELSFLEQALERVDDLVIALNRIDTQHGWRDVLDESAALLAQHASERMDDSIFPVSARMKSRADRLGGSEPGAAELAEEMRRDSGVPVLSERLGRWALSRSGALRAARLCRLGEQVVERLQAVERETRAARDSSDQELDERLQEKRDAQDGLARELPSARRRLRNEFTLMRREADASLTKRVNSLRRDFDRRLAEREVDDLENEIEAALYKALDDSLADVKGRLDTAESGMREALAQFGASLGPESSELEWKERPELGIVEPLTVQADGWKDQLGRSGSAAAMALVNPVLAVAAVGALLFDRRRTRRRAEQEQLSRQLAETVSDARSQLSIVIHQAVVNGEEILTETFEQAAATRKQELDEEIAALKARVAQSKSERAKEASGADERLRRLDEFDRQLSQTGEAALAALRSGFAG